MTHTKSAVDNRSVSVSLKPKTEKVYIPHFERNNKEKDYFARLDKGKISDVDTEVSKPKSKLAVKEYKKFVSVPTCHLCGVVGHIRPNCFLLRQEPKPMTRNPTRNTDVPKFVHVCHFCGVRGHIHPNCHKLNFKHSVFRSKICDDISPAISPYKLFHMLLKNLNLLARERRLQDFSISQKIGVIPQIHSTSHGFSPTKLKTCAIWVRKDSLRSHPSEYLPLQNSYIKFHLHLPLQNIYKYQSLIYIYPCKTSMHTDLKPYFPMSMRNWMLPRFPNNYRRERDSNEREYYVSLRREWDFRLNKSNALHDDLL